MARLGAGVMEYWSVERRTGPLHHSITPYSIFYTAPLLRSDAIALAVVAQRA